MTPYQHPLEIFKLYRKVLAERPAVVLEIGTARGGTLYLWTQSATDHAKIVSIDLPGGAFGGGYRACRVPFYQAFARPDQSLHLLRCDSTNAHTQDRVRKLLGDVPVDFLFIDADHSARAVSMNLGLYGPLVRAGGLIVLHDILPNPRHPGIEVWQVWNKIKAADYASDIADSRDARRPLGLGLIRVPRGGISDLLSSLNASPVDRPSELPFDA